MVNEVMEGKGVIAAIIKETGTTKQITDPASADIVYDGVSVLERMVFLECATDYGLDTSKTINKTDIVGTQKQKISEGSIEDTLSYNALVLEPAALGDTTLEFDSAGLIVHGVDADETAGSGKVQYFITSTGMRKAIRSSNTYTIRLFFGCTLDANEDADISTAKEVIDLEGVHLGSMGQSAPAGGDVTMTVSFEAETVSFPASYNTKPN